MLGPIEIEVIRNALTAAAAEMDVTVWRTSRSTIVRELLDYSTAVFDAEGNNLAQSARIPSHLNSMSHFLREAAGQVCGPGELGAGGCGHLQRPLLWRPAPAGHLRLQAGVP
ncbi:hydantoinase B/oxoprolinase family protein [Dankookia sp. P2]|uniref:hydantoinase B/oxoprolinase family protein n=1 Tax=Dankookia sp. P2 TaxID=3423955 RepID=UPI003D673133